MAYGVSLGGLAHDPLRCLCTMICPHPYRRFAVRHEASPWNGRNPLGFYQGAPEPLGLSGLGRPSPVSSMPLKGAVRREASRQDAVLG